MTVKQLTVVSQPGQTGGIGRLFGQAAGAAPATIVLSGLQGAAAERFKLTLAVDRDLFSTSAGKTVAARGSLSANSARRGFGFGRLGGRSLRGKIRFSGSGTNPGDRVAGTFEVEIVETHGGFLAGERVKVPKSKRAVKRRNRLKQAVVLLKKLDTNQDGQVQSHEWSEGQESFKLADANSDKTLSLKELIAWLNKK